MILGEYDLEQCKVAMCPANQRDRWVWILVYDWVYKYKGRSCTVDFSRAAPPVFILFFDLIASSLQQQTYAFLLLAGALGFMWDEDPREMAEWVNLSFVFGVN